MPTLHALQLIALFLVVPTLISPCQAYSASETDPHTTHAGLVLDSLSYLDDLMPSDSDLRPLLAAVSNLTAPLTRGAIDADHEGGDLTILGKDVDRNSLSHFYNPDTRRGYRAALDLRWVQTLESFGMIDGFLSQILGPAVSSESIAEWYYARAVQNWFLGGNETEAIRSLGYAAHLVADATVPQHSTDCGEENGSPCKHTLYEEFVDGLYGEWDGPTSSWEEVAALSMGVTSPGGLVVRASESSAPLLVHAAAGSEEAMRKAAGRMVPLAKELTAALVLRFLRDVTDGTPVEAAVLQIKRAWMQGAFTGEKTSADLMPFVRVVRPDGTLTEGEVRGYMADTNDVRPQEGMDGFGWSFVHWVTPEDFAAGQVTFHLELWDVEANFRCGSSCGEFGKGIVIGLNDQTGVNVTLPLDDATEDAALEGITSGCDAEALQRNLCDNSARIDYVVGRSYLVDGVKKESVVCDFTDSVTRGGMILIVFFFVTIAALAFCVLYGCFHWCRRRYRTGSAKGTAY